MIFNRQDLERATRKRLYNLAKYYKDQGENINITSRSKKDEIITALIEWEYSKELSEAKPENMSVRIERIWEAEHRRRD